MLIICVGILCYGKYFLVDKVCSGMFADWLKKNYLYEHGYYDVSTGEYVRTTEIQWPMLKKMIHKLANIFDKFFRLDEARATNTGGSGP